MKVQPYLFFDGRCEEAMEFYRGAIGAEATTTMRWRDAPEPPPGMVAPGSENKIMHAEMKIGDSVVMASDGDCMGNAKFDGVSLALTAADEAEADRFFAALAEGGEVRMPMSPTFFAKRFGMLADRFGVGWMVTTVD